MSYEAEISRANPTAFLFLLDQSASMYDVMPSGTSKAQHVADVLNRTLATLITRCTKAEGTRDYFEVGVLGYGGSDVKNAFQGPLASAVLQPISAVEAAPLRIDERMKKMDDGAGGIIEQAVKFPVWVDVQAAGGTPMRQAITSAAEQLATWCDQHRGSYPPTVLHVTDGESTDGDPEQLAEQLKQISTDDGGVLLLNLHVTTLPGEAINFPASDIDLPDEYAKLLFRMSSELPQHLLMYTRQRGYQVGLESRGFIFKGEGTDVVEFFDIGTRASQLR